MKKIVLCVVLLFLIIVPVAQSRTVMSLLSAAIGYGLELVTNGDFSSYSGSDPTVDFTGWSETEASGGADFDYNSGAEITVTSDPSSRTHINLLQTISVDSNAYYIVQYTANGGVGNSNNLQIDIQEKNDDYTVLGSEAITADGNDKSGEFIFYATGETSVWVRCQWESTPTTGDIATWKDVSVREKQ